MYTYVGRINPERSSEMIVIEHIKCPCCEHRFDAEVEWRECDRWPWPIYVAECPNCTFIIGESDWNKVERTVDDE